MPDPRSLLGRRVSLRHRLADGSAGATDVVGRVLDADATTLLVERRDGSVASVALADVLALRVVPDRPRRPRRAAAVDAEELTRVTSRGWPAPESVPLGDWELRWADGFTGRACSAAVHGDPGRPLDEALAAVVAFYRERDAVPRLQVVAGSDAERRALASGWEPQPGYRGGAVVQVADLPEPGEPDLRVTVGPTATADWLARYERVDDVAAARAVLEGPRTVGFARLGDPAVAVGRVVVTGEWAGVAAVEVHPDHRRQGLARAVVATCLAWAHDRGATRAYLQTMPENHAALALYAPFGFTTHHTYRYLVLADG